MLHNWGKESNGELESHVDALFGGKKGLDALLSGLPCGAIFSIYEKGTVPILNNPVKVMTNDAIFEIFGLEDDLFEGYEINYWLKKVLSQDIERLTQAYQNALESEKPISVECTLDLGRYKSVKTTLMITVLSKAEDYVVYLTTIPNPNTIYSSDTNMALKVQLDPMTGLFNKVAMEQIVKTRMTAKSENKFFLAVIDVDNFKNVNDMLGHLFGDEVIQDIASAISTIAPLGAFIGRVGGDEFLVFSDNCEEDEFLLQMKTLCEQARYEYVCDEGIVSATCSIGYVEGQLNNEINYEEYFHSADIAMYVAKQNGKAQCCKYNHKMRMKRRATDKNILLQQRKKTENFGENRYDAEFVATAYGLLSDSKKIATSISLLLRKISERFQLSSVRVYEWEQEKKGYCVDYGWSKEQKQTFYPTDKTLQEKWFQKNGVIESSYIIDDFSTLSEELRDNLSCCVNHALVSTNLIHSVETCGFICFEAKEMARDWSAYEVATFEALTKAVSAFIFLEKEKQKDKKIIELISKKDEITGLYKKKAFEQMSQDILLNKQPDKVYGFLYVDICKFSLLNERYGYDSGNEVLKVLAEKFVQGNCVRLACRSHSDCYILFVENDARGSLIVELECLLGDALRTLNQKYRGHVLQLKAGLYVLQPDEINIETMIENANLARKQIHGKDGKFIQIYEERFRSKRIQTIQLTAEFFDALENEEIQLFFQPVFQLNSNQLVSTEAFVGWQGKDGCMRTPKEFLEALEKSGNMEKLDYTVFELVLKQLNVWKKQGMKLPRVGVNFSLNSCERYGFSTRIRRMAKQYDIEPGSIQIEIAMATVEKFTKSMEREIDELKKTGFKIAVDHFDLGFVMSKMLSKPWLDTVKLDPKLFSSENSLQMRVRSLNFVHEMMAQPEKMIIVGAETKEDILQIQKSGFCFVQGFFYEKVIAVDLFAQKYLTKESAV